MKICERFGELGKWGIKLSKIKNQLIKPNDYLKPKIIKPTLPKNLYYLCWLSYPPPRIPDSNVQVLN